MQLLSDLQAEQLCGGRRGGLLARSSWRDGQGAGRFGGGSQFSFQSILNVVNQLNLAINIVIGGGTIHNNQANVLSMQSSM